MKILKGIILIVAVIATAVGLDLACEKSHQQVAFNMNITSPQDIVALFPKTTHEIDQRVDHALKVGYEMVQRIIDVPDDKRSYANTAQVLDTLTYYSEPTVTARVIQILLMVSPEKEIRDTAQKAVQRMDDFWVDVNNNIAIYQAFKAYAQGNARHESLSHEQQYYITEQMKAFDRSGLNLPEDKRAEIKRIQKELAKLSQDFETNIASDNRTITVKPEGLAGLEKDFIDALQRSIDGNYILGVDYPTYSNVMENAFVEDTRMQLSRAFINRAYPVNDALLKSIIAKRDELAKILGYADYAHLNLDNSMVQSPERAEKFLDDILIRAKPKVEQEFAAVTKELPEGVTLTADGKMKPWDSAYVKSSYKKKHFAIDERAIAEYFPMEKTIEALLDIYHQFLGINFKEAPIHGLWTTDIRLVEVTDVNDGSRLGYLVLDLHPRDNKYSHACEIGIIPAVVTAQGEKPAALAMVIANFPKSTATRPSLLQRKDVETFFHEFGHALHELLGRTTVAALAGTEVKRDFVEMPSQMLEEWLWDDAILKKVSSHYTTKETLPDELIAKIKNLKHFDSGDWVQRQAMLSKLSLALYGPGAVKDPNAVMQQLQESIRTHVLRDPQDHFYAAFGHLTGYGAQYYGYLWSKVFALDLFSEIKKQGLLNPVIGKKYIQEVIGRGGSDDPNVLLVNFLGRQPNSDAFFADLGI